MLSRGIVDAQLRGQVRRPLGALPSATQVLKRLAGPPLAREDVRAVAGPME